MGEFDLIERFFAGPARAGEAVGAGFVARGIGDDCALLRPAPGQQLAVSTDMLVEGRHFLSTVEPSRLGHKALAVNLSDLAACGATPRAFTLALSMPRADESWLAPFSRGLLDLAHAHGCVLAGGDTTMGPLNICITVFGEVPVDEALLRGGARLGNDIYVSGQPGEARAALEVFRGALDLSAADFAQARERMERPTPRVALGQALRGLAGGAVDVSDGLLGDLGHILRASGLGARIDAESVEAGPVRASSVLRALPPRLALNFVLAGGDDYELCFTARPELRDRVLAAARASGTPVWRIGQTTDSAQGLRVHAADGHALDERFTSFDHFS